MNDLKLQQQILHAMMSTSLPATGGKILEEFVRQNDKEMLVSRLYANIEFMEGMGWVTSKTNKEGRYEFNITDKGKSICLQTDTEGLDFSVG